MDPLALRDRLEQWITTHEADLELPDGLTTTALALEPADNFRVEQGLLTLYRFRQTYAASPSHPEVPVMGEGALLTLQADPSGAVALTGTIVDPRVAYAHATSQAPASQAAASIKRHASLRTGIAEADVEVSGLQLVLVPWAEQIAWYGVPMSSHVSMGRIIVDADPAVSGLLELLMYDDGTAHALHDTTPIEVQTQDPLGDPWGAPIMESLETTLWNAAPILGSSFDGTGEPQLGTPEVVVLDLQGGRFSPNLYDQPSMTWAFDRYVEASGQFLAANPDEQFLAQRLYVLAQGGYAVLDRVARGQWDAGISHWYPGLMSAFPPGSYRPRIMVGYNHASVGGTAAASLFFIEQAPQVMSGFPEAIHQPGPNLQNEPIMTILAPAGIAPVHVLFHEVGHNADASLAPGIVKSDVPRSCPGCAPCEEDTSAEANPLTETFAQMFAMWQLVRVFPDIPHDTCNLMHQMAAGGSLDQRPVHSPGCMGPGDSLNLFLRDHDPLCPDVAVCDKPNSGESDLDMGAAHWCDATDGYNTFSVLQVWWNFLHGLYCGPPGPMGVGCDPFVVVWPPNCDQPGSGVDCATPDEVAGLAFLYAVRSDPKSYVQFFDDMAKFVACNYGATAYDVFNQALCDHQIRDCDASPPMVCAQCGNGIRESPEQCDGADLSVEGLGLVPSCVDFGYEGGDLACQGSMDPQPCQYDFSQCTIPGLDDTGAPGLFTSTDGGVGEGSVESSTGEDTTAPGGVDGGSGCGCTSGGTNGGGRVLCLMPVFLLATSRRRQRRASGVALWLALGAAACADDGPSSFDDESSSTSVASSTTSTPASSGETASVPSGWPEDWYGDYYEDPDPAVLGYSHPIPYLNVHGFWNARLEPGAIEIERFVQDIDGEARLAKFATEVDRDFLRVVPPDGEWTIAYFFDGADEVLFRPGEGCGELVLEVRGESPLYDPPWSTSWWRGTICVVDPYDHMVDDDRWSIDLCPDAVTTCEP